MSRWREVIEDERGALSSKRIAGLASVAVLNLSLLADTFTRNIQVDDGIVWAVTAIALGGLGLSSIDKHSPAAKVDAKMTERRETAELKAVADA